MKSYINSIGYFQAVIDNLEDELMVIDRDYRILQANKAVMANRGKGKEEIIGKYCYDIAHGPPELCQPPYHECPVKRVWETNKPARVTHLHVYGQDIERQKRYVDIIASPITDDQGDVIAVASLMRDVTEAKEMELKITKAYRYLTALNDIASVVSQSLDLDTVLSSSLDKTLEIMQVNTGGILLWDEEKQMLCYRVHHGLSKDYVQGVCCRLGEGIAGRVARTGEAILVEDVSKDPRAAYPGLITTDGLQAFASVPLRSKDKILGVLNIANRDTRKFTSDDVILLENLAAQIAVAVENAILHQKLRQQDESRGELLQEIFSIQEEERKRIARELHDETAQTLASLAASLEVVASVLPAGTRGVRTRLKKLQSLSIGILDEIHKIIYELRPTLLDDLGLVAATRWLIENNLEVDGISVNFQTIGRERRLPSHLETALFRVIQEAINNIVRHACARNADVSLHFKKSATRVSIKDDGKGFNVDEAITSKERPRGLGLLGMKERVELLNGTFTISSRPEGGGTQIDIEIPMKVEVSNA